MNAMQQLESMGYRFRLDGEHVRYALYGGRPPPEADALLQSLDKDFVRTVLLARASGCVTIKPQIVRIQFGDWKRYLMMLSAAKDSGELAHVKVIYIRKTKEFIFELLPPGVDFMKYDPMKGEST